MNSVRSKLARSKELISETLQLSSAKKNQHGLKSPNSVVKHEFFTINQRIDKLMKLVHNKETNPQERKNASISFLPFEIKSKTPDVHKQRIYARGIKSKNSKSSADVCRSSTTAGDPVLTASNKTKEKTVKKSQSPSKNEHMSSSKPRVTPFGVKTSIQAFGLKNLTIKNIVVNQNPKQNSVPYEIDSLRPPKPSSRSIMEIQNLGTNNNHHSRVRSFCAKKNRIDQANIDDQSLQK